MSEHTAAFGVSTLLTTDMDPVELGLEMLGLMEAVDFEYERWCRVLGLDPDTDVALQAYDRAFYTYPAVWRRVGEHEFARMMAEATKKWRRLIY